MGFKDELENDLDKSFFNSSEFAEEVAITPSAVGSESYVISGIFDRMFQGVNVGNEDEILSTHPTVRFQDSALKHDLASDAGTKITVRGVVYRSITVEPDGVGTTICVLHKDL